jgi:hypothetical protein
LCGMEMCLLETLRQVKVLLTAPPMVNLTGQTCYENVFATNWAGLPECPNTWKQSTWIIQDECG